MIAKPENHELRKEASGEIVQGVIQKRRLSVLEKYRIMRRSGHQSD